MKMIRKKDIILWMQYYVYFNNQKMLYLKSVIQLSE
jgi:hypothetical protein